MYDLIIIGSGPAGLTAAIYATRAKLDFIIIEQNFMSGGQVVNTYEVDNYPATPGINGMDLSMKMREHAEGLGAVFVTEAVTSVDLTGDVKLATGAEHRKLGIPGELELAGMGVSYCATCDGAFFRGKDVAVVGGGDVAVEDAIFLARLCNKVYVIHRRDELRAAKVLQDRLLSLPNVEMCWSYHAKSIEGEGGMVTKLNIMSAKDGSEKTLDVSGVFMAVGIQPTNELFTEQLETDKGGYIVAGEDGKTNLPGVFANAVTSVQEYLLTH